MLATCRPDTTSSKYTSKLLLHSVLLALRTKGGGQHLKDIVRDALRLVFPLSSAQTLMESLEKEGSMPSPALVTRSRVVVDLTLLMIARESDLVPCARYAWADASPAKGHEWIWFQAVVIADEQLLPAFEAVTRLVVYVQKQCNVNEASDGTDWGDDETILELLSVLHMQVRAHTFIPVALATSRADLSKKAQAVVHMLAMEARSWQALQMTLSNIISFTSDLGTESRLAGFGCSLKSVVPSWFSPSVQMVLMLGR